MTQTKHSHEHSDEEKQFELGIVKTVATPGGQVSDESQKSSFRSQPQDSSQQDVEMCESVPTNTTNIATETQPRPRKKRKRMKERMSMACF